MNGDKAMPAPLDGITVVDASTTFVGPYASLLMGQLGARVIKVEAFEGDIARYVNDHLGIGLGSIFLNANRGKESVVLNLKKSAGRNALDRLVKNCDVFIHNMRPQAMNRLRIDGDTLLAVNPRLIYCHAVGFGGTGPYRDRPAYDDVIQGMTGLAALQTADGEPGYVRTVIADKNAGLMVAIAILAAINERHHSGIGQAIEVPMFETMASWTLLEQQGGYVFSERPSPPGYVRTASPFRRPYATADGYIGLMGYTDAHWRDFFSLIDRSELAADARFATITERTRNIDELYQIVADALPLRTTAEWLDDLSKRHIPASPIMTIADLFDDEHLKAVGFFEEVAHPSAGLLVQTRLPWTYSRSRYEAVPPAPDLGQHTQAVLREAGLSDAEIDEVLADGEL
jgi:crotonobetainyl-CoA:carnitine CoA-transferase CaiB-like acyl-CoA transferase